MNLEAGYDYKRIYQNMSKPAFLFDGRNVVDIKAMEEIGFEVNRFFVNLGF